MILNELLEDITSYVNQYKDYEYKTFKSNEDRHQDDEYMEQLRIVLDEELNTYLGVVTQAIEDLQKLSVKENYYFFDCAFKVYENHYLKRKDEFLKDHIDVNEADFIKEELISRLDARMNRRLKWGRGTYFYHQFIHPDNTLSNSEFKKREFLIYKLELQGWSAYLMNDENSAAYYRFEKNNNYQSLFKKKVDTENMNASSFLNYIAQTILDYKEFEYNEGELLGGIKDMKNPHFSEKERNELSKRDIAFEEKLIKDRKKISELLRQLYYKSSDDNFYWFDCPLQVYFKNLESNFKKYKSEFLDDNIEDFLKEEVSKLSNYNKNQFLNYNNEQVDYSSFIDYSNKIFSKTRGKKLEYLNQKLNEKNIHLDSSDSYKLRGKTTLVPKFEYKESKAQKEIHTGFINNFKTNNAQEKNSNVEKGIDNYSNKIKWTGKPSQLGYLIGVLASLDYMDTPRKSNGETNYSAFARQIIEHFEIETTEGSLAKYLNIESEKAQELARKLNDNDFYIPHSKTIS